jgi:hypothetical protein
VVCEEDNQDADFCPAHPRQRLTEIKDKEFNLYFGLTTPVLCCPLPFCDYIQMSDRYFARMDQRIQLLVFARQ